MIQEQVHSSEPRFYVNVKPSLNSKKNSAVTFAVPTIATNYCTSNTKGTSENNALRSKYDS